MVERSPGDRRTDTTYGVISIINASGPVTRLSGSPMRGESIEALATAARSSYCVEEVQAAASRAICRITGTEAALVTNGAAAGLMLGTAAILCGLNLARMEQLPFLSAGPDEFIVARSHRNGYDHAVRAAGARLIEIGYDEISAGSGVRRPELWEWEAAVGPRTAGLLFVMTDTSAHLLPELVQMAHSHQVPVLVDAAAQLPPAQNLRMICDSAADLVVFSGGKAIGGPQGTGILCGRQQLVGSAFLQMMDQDDHFQLWAPPREFVDKSLLPGMPRHGIGRALKVASADIFALLAALDAFIQDDAAPRRERYRRILECVMAELRHTNCDMHMSHEDIPELHIGLRPEHPVTAMQACRSLRDGPPRIFVGHRRLSENVLIIHPSCLDESQSTLVGRQIALLLGK